MAQMLSNYELNFIFENGNEIVEESIESFYFLSLYFDKLLVDMCAGMMVEHQLSSSNF